MRYCKLRNRSKQMLTVLHRRTVLPSVLIGLNDNFRQSPDPILALQNKMVKVGIFFQPVCSKQTVTPNEEAKTVKRGNFDLFLSTTFSKTQLRLYTYLIYKQKTKNIFMPDRPLFIGANSP